MPTVSASSRDERKAVLDESGFRPDSEQVRVAQAIIHDFAFEARKDGTIPVIFLVNNLGYSDYFYRGAQPDITGRQDSVFELAHDCFSERSERLSAG